MFKGDIFSQTVFIERLSWGKCKQHKLCIIMDFTFKYDSIKFLYTDNPFVRPRKVNP